MSNFVYIHDLTETANHAGFKARYDVLEILSDQSHIKVVKIPLSIGNRLERLSSSFNFIRFLFSLSSNDNLIINYPLAKPYGKLLEVMMAIKSFKLTVIVHDLNSLRKKDKEDSLIYKASNIISHNKVMTDYLRDIKVQGVNIIELELFDYLLAESTSVRRIAEDEKISLLVAGNLTKEKAGYIYSWQPSYPVDVYGVNFQKELAIGELNYCGIFDANIPDQTVSATKAYYGLVWDGDSQAACSGIFGHYLQYNNPHKASLYLSLSIPIIVWSKSALADFVRREGCGIVIDSLDEIEDIMHDTNKWNLCYRSATVVAEKVRSGKFLARAIERCEYKN
ncbi:MAG: hypothetical protein ACRCWW_17180 [Scandinavium sp.]|uniref:hypothetical protein n=1 Tax=Scandinavium sp. TaxID=2830653 RepID=UPI003F2C93D8